MTRIQIPSNTLALTGISLPSATTGTTNYYFDNPSGRTWLDVQNSTSPAQTVTIVSSYTAVGLGLEDDVVTIPANGTKLIGPFSTGIFNQIVDAPKVYVDTTSTLLNLRAYTLP